MIAKISKRRCPIIEISSKNSWTVHIESLESDGRFLKRSGCFISGAELINLTEFLGMLAYAIKTDAGFTIFDLSFSHLCPKQIKAAMRHLYEAYC